jgi:TrmH family RNA methyltransferase
MKDHHHRPISIDSRNHLAIKRIRRLQLRDERERTGLYYVEGVRFVAQAVQHMVPIETLVVCRPLLVHPFAQKLVRRQRQAGTPILDVTPAVLHSIALVDDPQGIGAVVRQRWEQLERVRLANDLCWIVLDVLRSPGNLGTILRTSEAVGGAGIIVLGDAIDPYDPATLRSSMGVMFAQRFVRTTVDALRVWKQRHSCQLVGTSPAAPTDYRDVAYHPPTLLLMGEERNGLPPELQALCDVMVRIPIVGQSDSLNVAVATGVMLYEVFTQCRRDARVPKDVSHG